MFYIIREVGELVTVKMLKPYYIKMNSEYIRIILAYQYFSLLIDKKVYHFVPIEGREILINRSTKRVVNTNTKFAFQKDKEIIYITVKKLTTLVDFMTQLDEMIEPYYSENTGSNHGVSMQTIGLIKEIELVNLKRLIDKALDERDEVLFNDLTKLI